MPVDKCEIAKMYYFKVVGGDLSQDRIEDGDIVLIREECDVRPNDMCLVNVLPYSTPVLRKVIQHGGEYVFSTASSFSNPIHNKFSEVVIIGKVVEVNVRL